MEITNYKGTGWIFALMVSALMVIGIALAIFLSLLVSPVSAEVFVYGSVPNYSAVILPNNSYVHQGENISQGNYYDLRGIYGFSGQLAHWDSDYLVGQGQPNQIITLSGTHLEYIDPAKYPVGRWFQWDGEYCSTDSDYCTTGFGNGNAYVFAVVPAQKKAMQAVKVTRSANITISSGEGTITVPVTYSEIVNQPIEEGQTSHPTTTPTLVNENARPPVAVPTNPDIQDRNGVTIPGGVSGAVVVTQKAPIAFAIPVFAVIVGLIVMRRKK
jgi:hypothetical protein